MVKLLIVSAQTQSTVPLDYTHKYYVNVSLAI